LRSARKGRSRGECQTTFRFNRPRCHCFGWLDGAGSPDGRGSGGDGGESGALRPQERALRGSGGSIAQPGGAALALECDVKDKAAIQQVVEATLAKFGRVDILINNAGVSWGASVEDMTLEQWDKVLSTNLTGTFLFCQAVGKTMVARGSGKIINIASVAGLGGGSAELQAIGYHASKGGVIAFTKDLACKWAPHNIQVNAIAPGWFPTHMSSWVIEHRKDSLLEKIPLGRFGGDHDLKGAAVFLASDASAYVTGHVLVVDGGQTAW